MSALRLMHLFVSHLPKGLQRLSDACFVSKRPSPSKAASNRQLGWSPSLVSFPRAAYLIHRQMPVILLLIIASIYLLEKSLTFIVSRTAPQNLWGSCNNWESAQSLIWQWRALPGPSHIDIAIKLNWVIWRSFSDQKPIQTIIQQFIIILFNFLPSDISSFLQRTFSWHP